MNYYEELGLAENASADEIHRAYRNLARLLHPDQQPDESVRRLAEVQMKRLNRIHETLGDPVERRKYDLSLRDGESGGAQYPGLVALRPARAFPHQRRGLAAGDATWVVTALIAGAAMCGYVGTQASPPPQPASAVGKTSAGPRASAMPPRAVMPDTARRRQVAALSSELIALRQELEAARSERDTALAQLAEHDFQAREEFRSAGEDTSAPPAHVPPAGRSPASASPAISGIPPPDAIHGRWAGTWVYVPLPLTSGSMALYPPDYIEMVISEHNGSIRGRYRARYLITDRAIPSEVRFQFEGEAERDAAHLNWTGVGGARGEVRLRLVSDHSLEVNWTALELGNQMGLVSGTSVLTRRLEQ